MTTSLDHLQREDESELRLAVIGHVGEGKGSVPSAHFQLCRALLVAGHHIDLYGVPGFVSDPGYNLPRFRYVPINLRTWFDANADWLPPDLRRLAQSVIGRNRSRRFRARAMRGAFARHRVVPYNAVLFLGTPPGSPIPGIPTVVWPQSGPKNELIAVRGLRESVVRLSGWRAYVRLRLYYEIKDGLGWSWARRHSLILASNAGREQALRFGIAPDRILVVPYPIDLERFSPAALPRDRTHRVLCIGRLDPRKRVDLLVDATELLASYRSDFHVDVIGRDGYLQGWRTFVVKASERLPISYVPQLSQLDVLHRLQEAALVVQPSEREEFGHAVAEALACGIPVVVGPTNGTGDYVPAHGSVRFDAYTPASLARAIDEALNLATSPSARSACRAAAQAFTADSVAANVADFIRRAPPSDPDIMATLRRTLRGTLDHRVP